jgi:hypothetical protein
MTWVPETQSKFNKENPQSIHLPACYFKMG